MQLASNFSTTQRGKPQNPSSGGCDSKSGNIDVRFRTGRRSDAVQIQRLVWSERMNPLALDPARFVVATDTNSDDMIAAGQLVPIGAAVELRSLVVLPSHQCACC